MPYGASGTQQTYSTYLLGIALLGFAAFMGWGLPAGRGAGLPAKLALAADTTPWIAPASAKSVKNPVAATPASVAEGKEIYMQNCVPCHGDKGDGQGLMGSSLDPPASDFTKVAVMRTRTDGELFWKMGEGRSQMPSFKDQLNDMQRWNVVNFLRTFSTRAATKKPPLRKTQN